MSMVAPSESVTVASAAVLVTVPSPAMVPLETTSALLTFTLVSAAVVRETMVVSASMVTVPSSTVTAPKVESDLMSFPMLIPESLTSFAPIR